MLGQDVATNRASRRPVTNRRPAGQLVRIWSTAAPTTGINPADVREDTRLTRSTPARPGQMDYGWLGHTNAPTNTPTVSP